MNQSISILGSAVTVLVLSLSQQAFAQSKKGLTSTTEFGSFETEASGAPLCGDDLEIRMKYKTNYEKTDWWDSNGKLIYQYINEKSTGRETGLDPDGNDIGYIDGFTDYLFYSDLINRVNIFRGNFFTGLDPSGGVVLRDAGIFSYDRLTDDVIQSEGGHPVLEWSAGLLDRNSGAFDAYCCALFGNLYQPFSQESCN